MKVTVFALIALFTWALAFAADSDMTQDRAQEVANYYFARYFPDIGCGGAMRPTLRGDYWESVVAVGEDASPSGTIRVYRSTGMVSYDGPLGRTPPASAESLFQWALSTHATRKP